MKLLKKLFKKDKSKKTIVVNNGQNNKLVLVCRDGTTKINPYIRGLKIEFRGNNSTVFLTEPCGFVDCCFRLGDDNTIEIGPSVHTFFKMQMPYKMRQGAKLAIGRDFSCMGVDFYLHDEPNITVTIGDDVMISFGVIIWPSDGHSIQDMDGNFLNPAQDIVIGNHVWIGMHSKILKGAQIPDNSMLGACSIFLRKSNIKQSDKKNNGGGYAFAGAPAHIIKDSIIWNRPNCYDMKNIIHQSNKAKK